MGDREERGDQAKGERDVDEEVGFHLEMQVRALMEAGWPEDSARLEAARRFGDVENVRRRLIEIDRRRGRRQRVASGFQDLRRDLKFALRGLGRRPVFTAVSVITLALGIGGTSAVFALIDGALVRALPFPQDERLVYVRDNQGDDAGLPASRPELDDWLAGSGEFLESAMGLATTTFTWTGEGPAEVLLVGVLVGDPMRTYGLSALIGRGFTTDEVETGARVLMLSESFWTDRFGRSPDVIGRVMTLNEQSYTIIGVMPREAGALRPNNPPVMWTPMTFSAQMTRGLHFIDVIGRLRADLTRESATPRVEAMAALLQSDGRTDHGVHLTSLREELVGESRAELLILLGAVLAVLAIVCANVANLVLAQSLERSREFAVRVSIGAGRNQLARQVVTESVVLGLIGGITGIGAAWVLARGFHSVSVEAAYLAGSPFDSRVLLFTLLVAVMVSVLFGLMPALRVARTDLAGVLRAAGDARNVGGRGALRRRRVLTGAELALCVVLLASAGLLVRSMVNLLRQDPGFEPRNVLVFGLALAPNRYDENERPVFVDELLRRLRELPGIVHAAVASHLPLDRGDTSGGFEIVGKDFAEDEAPYSKKRIVSADYFAALGIPLLRGRTFTGADREGAPEVAIITESLAHRWWGNEDPLGRRIRFLWGSEAEQEIVGIAGDVKHDGLDRPVEGMIFVPAAQFPQSGINVVLRTTSRPAAMTEAVRRIVSELDPAVPLISVRTMEDVVAGSVAGRRTTLVLFVAFASLALLLATLGVYAIAAQAVTQRTPEIGLRMAVGASQRDVLTLVLRQELPAILLGMAVGSASANAATRVLRASLYDVSPADPLTLVAAVALLGAVALVATLVPARRAARLDPLLALRNT